MGPSEKINQAAQQTLQADSVQMNNGLVLNAQRVRNPKAGKNFEMGRNKEKEVKLTTKKNFKANSGASAKASEKLKQVMSRELQEQVKKEKKLEETQILDRMKNIQLQQQDTLQACQGWSEALL